MAHFCFDPKSKLIPMDEVKSRMHNCLSATTKTLNLTTVEAYNYVAAEDIIAPRDIPEHTNAGLDGYAIYHDEYATSYNLIGRIGAGDAVTPINKGEAVRINTGAPVPKEANAVIAIEESTTEGDLLYPQNPIKIGNGIRPAGEDLKKGDVAVEKGERIDSSSIALLSACGVKNLDVFAPLRVGVLSSGSELIEVGTEHSHGQIYDTNRPFLISTLKKNQAKVIDGGIVQDQQHAMLDKINELSEQCDCIITSAGASASDADFTSMLLDQQFDMVLWRIALRPGRPFGFGFANKIPIFVLPGNPIAVISTWSTLVKDAVSIMQGETLKKPIPIQMPLGEDLNKKIGRTELYRMRIDNDDNTLIRSGAQGSGILSGVHQGDGFVILDHDDDSKKKGDYVPFYPKSYFF